MSGKKKRDTPEWKWQTALLTEYYEYRWRKALDPLHEAIHRWNDGDREDTDIDRAVHEAHNESRRIYNIFTGKREHLVLNIQSDHEWFKKWMAGNPPPPGVKIIPDSFFK